MSRTLIFSALLLTFTMPARSENMMTLSLLSAATQQMDLAGPEEFAAGEPSLDFYREDLAMAASINMTRLNVVNPMHTVPEPAALGLIGAGLLMARKRRS